MYEILFLLLAGIGAGVVTGLIGGSAVLISVPIMIIFLEYDIFTAIGLSLGIDVIASIMAAAIYRKHKNLDFRIGIHMSAIAIIGVIIGTAFSFYIPKALLTGATGFGICFSGVNFLTKKIKEETKEIVEDLHLHYKSKKYWATMFFALIVGFIGGSFGAGGGLSILLILTFILGFRIHKAIGTSIFIMIFVALSGAISHFIYQPFPIWIIFVAGIGAIFGSKYSAKIANVLTEKQLNKLAGILFVALGIALIIKQLYDSGYWIYLIGSLI